MVDAEQLRRFPYFAGADDDSLRKLAMASEWEEYDAGEIVFRDRQQADRLYILDHGRLEVAFELMEDEIRVIDTLVPGELAMWSSLVEPYRSTALGRAREDVRLIAVDAATLRALCEQDHALGYAVYRSVARVLAERLTNARVQLVGEL